MSLFFQYLLKLSISLAVVYLFYYFLLRKLTFYSANRWYLLLYSFASFLIPLINISPVLQRNQMESSGIVSYIPAVSSRITMSDPGIASTIAYEDARLMGQWVVFVLAVGVLLMLVKLFIQYISFLRVKRSSTLIVSEPVRIFQVDQSIIPFSIGNSIFINQHLHKEEELKEIIRHEFIHVKQKHSIDIFLSELLCVLNWFNPFAWLIRRAIKENLEFIADNKVLEGGLDKKQYQYLLLKVIGVPQFCITAQFNFSSLKKRIAMMNKKQSTRAQLLKLLLLLPVLVVVLLAFRSAGKHMPWNFSEQLNNIQDTIPAPPPPKPPVPAVITNKDVDEFLKRNPGVKGVSILNNTLTIELKSGGTEKYNLSNESEFRAAEKKYGRLHLMPPPPPPPPPKPALPKDVKSISITETKATVVLSNGKKEVYDLTKLEELEAFQHKYQPMEDPSSFTERQLMELNARQELMSLKMEKEKEFELLRREYENEAQQSQEKRALEIERMQKEKQMELELLHKKFQLEAQQHNELLKKEYEKASKEKGANAEKLLKQYKLEQEREMANRELELLKVTKEKEIEMEMLQKKFDLDMRMELESRKNDMENREREMMIELEEKNAMLQKINLDSKNLSAEQKKEVISQLEVQKKELNKLMQDLKAKESEINKRIQDLKKAQGKN